MLGPQDHFLEGWGLGDQLGPGLGLVVPLPPTLDS